VHSDLGASGLNGRAMWHIDGGGRGVLRLIGPVTSGTELLVPRSSRPAVSASGPLAHRVHFAN